MDKIAFALVLRDPDFVIPISENWEGPKLKDSEYYMSMMNCADVFYNVISGDSFVTYEKVYCRFTTSNGRRYVIRLAIQIPADKVIKNADGFIPGPTYVLDEVSKIVINDLFDRIGDAYRLKPRPDYNAEKVRIEECLSQFHLDKRWGKVISMAPGDSKPAIVNVPEGKTYLAKYIPINGLFSNYTSVAIGEFRNVSNSFDDAQVKVPDEAKVVVTSSGGSLSSVMLTTTDKLFRASDYGFSEEYFDKAEISLNLTEALKWVNGNEPLPVQKGVSLFLDYPTAEVRLSFRPEEKTREFSITVVDDANDAERSAHAHTVLDYVDNKGVWGPIPAAFVVKGDRIGSFIDSASKDSFKTFFKSRDKEYKVTNVLFSKDSGEIVITVHYTEPPKPVVLPEPDQKLYRTVNVQVTLADDSMYRDSALVTVTQKSTTTDESLTASYVVEWDKDKDQDAAPVNTPAKGKPINTGSSNKQAQDKDAKGAEAEIKTPSAPVQKRGRFCAIVRTEGYGNPEAVYGDPAISKAALLLANDSYTVTFQPQSEDVSFLKALFSGNPSGNKGVAVTRVVLIIFAALLLMASFGAGIYFAHDHIKTFFDRENTESVEADEPEAAADDALDDNSDKQDEAATSTEPGDDVSEEEQEQELAKKQLEERTAATTQTGKDASADTGTVQTDTLAAVAQDD